MQFVRATTYHHLAPGYDADGVKLYSVTATPAPVEVGIFLPQLEAMKSAANVAWRDTPAFAIFHRGASLPYLVLCWWGNDDELFVRVGVRESTGWVVDSARYSFCLWDMEIMWHERQGYIRWMYSDALDLAAYRADVMSGRAYV